MNPGGRTFAEQEAWDARERLEKASEVHQVMQLPCCGSMVEYNGGHSDQFVLCPNPACRKRHVILSGRSAQIQTEEPDPNGHIHLSY